MSHSPLRYLHSFLTVANEGSFVRAADRLAVSQPALSYQMRQLEQWLGVPLFERAGRKLVLTRAGASVRAWCRDAFAGLDELRAALHSGETECVSLKLASGAGFGRYVLMPALLDPAPESDAPLLDDVRLELAFGSDDEVFAHVESGRADLGFVYTPRTSRLFQHHAVYTEEFVLACGAQALRERGAAPRTLADCAALPFVTYDESDAVYGLWFQALFRRMPETTVSAHHVSELEEVATLVAAGMGWSVLPLHAIRDAVASARLQVVRPVSARRCRNTVFAVRRTSSFPSEAQDRLLVRLAQLEAAAAKA
ncbi:MULTISPECIES: LysR family transcriptional regulator [Ralstonia solanacearum species complex]|uniref:HTH lysR-type domain-containing protein n=2 Tax=Ralstonia solanacearum TaxID=305 RepID=A0ABF7R983_RALSL|nr:LysR family transcriptional regulator [Ralstonia solanacearum]ALF89403.1 HTH-type transcriptional regulator CynR [Ralstonia solanacearum]ATI28790.1 LysR family transcriptional regulator [Ralstonia solanacearum]EAP74465.1 Transcriptional regulatory protein [Ralstonia solanacearum UW551]KEI34199.1 LysR family transcriptional regulator [Ralstonia solanacearum]KFX80180.1 LysR family transcriptional regulator [Ralstonia solanacearum]